MEVARRLPSRDLPAPTLPSSAVRTSAQEGRESGDDPEYFWDLLNRMTAYFPDGDPGDETRYAYRADGMRTLKADSYSASSAETKYYYDGQMGVMDVEVYDPASGPNVTTVRKYGVGARGIDVITKKVDSGSEQFGYPVYDTHGNMVATLARSGSHDYSVGNVQFYDVWGGVRSGSSTEDQGYVANLGHRRDDESGLTYMRARYYEPFSGRFISEDFAADGANWFLYGKNRPTCSVDPGGTSVWGAAEAFRMCMLGYSLIMLYLTVRYTTDSLDVEGAYGKFMQWHSWNFWIDVVGLNEDLVEYADIISSASTAYATVAKKILRRIAKALLISFITGGSVSPVAIAVAATVGAAQAAVDIIGADNAMMFAAYAIRIGHYVEQTD